jgi:predicted lipoprotein with Yx(FWY)xxD motif
MGEQQEQPQGQEVHAMKRLLIAAAVVAVVVVVGVAIAANGGGGGKGSKGSSAAPASSAGAATVSAEQISGSGNVLVDSKGEALYANDQEKNGMPLCSGACLSFWIPLTLHGGMPRSGSLGGKLGVVKRPGGAKQVTFDGKLLYTFYLDKPGKVSGDGFNDAFGGRHFTWHVVHANGTTSSTGSGQPGNTIPGY